MKCRELQYRPDSMDVCQSFHQLQNICKWINLFIPCRVMEVPDLSNIFFIKYIILYNLVQIHKTQYEKLK